MKIYLKVILFASALIFTVSCGGLKGEFSFKNFGDDIYKKKTGDIEVASNEELFWIYKFPGTYKAQKNFSVIYKKKELVWVDILNYTDAIYYEKSQLFGTIKDLPAGEYNLIIFDTASKKIIDELLFKIYDADEDDDAAEEKPVLSGN